MALIKTVLYKTKTFDDATFVIRECLTVKDKHQDIYKVTLKVDSYVNSDMDQLLFDTPRKFEFNNLTEPDLKWNKYYAELKKDPYFEGASET